MVIVMNGLRDFLVRLRFVSRTSQATDQPCGVMLWFTDHMLSTCYNSFNREYKHQK
jgi:hypothetical protein